MRAIGVGAAIVVMLAGCGTGVGEKTVVDTRVQVRYLSGEGDKASVRPRGALKDVDGKDWLAGWKTGIQERVKSADLVAKAKQGEIQDCRIQIVKKPVAVERNYKDAELTECRKVADATPLESQVRVGLTIGRVAAPTFQGLWQFPKDDPEIERLLLILPDRDPARHAALRGPVPGPGRRHLRLSGQGTGRVRTPPQAPRQRAVVRLPAARLI